MADMMMMAEKWQMIFKLLDFNRDGVISSKDRDDCKESFIATYKPNPDQSKAMLADLDELWNFSIFLTGTPDWSRSFKADDFVASRREMFEKDKSATVAATRRATENLCSAADMAGNKSFSYDQFKTMHNAFNLTDENFIKGLFQVCGGAASGSCSLDNVVEFYTELIMGENVDKHQMCKAAFAAAGF